MKDTEEAIGLVHGMSVTQYDSNYSHSTAVSERGFKQIHVFQEKLNKVKSLTLNLKL